MDNTPRTNDYTKRFRVYAFMLRDGLVPKGEIFFVITGGLTEEEHKAGCERHKQELLRENDDTYTSWVFVDQIQKKLSGVEPFATVLGFRVGNRLVKSNHL